MMIATVMKRRGKSALGSMLASAGTLLLRKRFPAEASQEQRQATVVAPNVELRVLGFPALIERTRTNAVVQLLRIQMGFPREVFERAVSPVIEGYAAFVQLSLVPESQQHGSPDDHFIRALNVASRALDYRRGQILPRGAAPEVIGAQAHRWTYAVFVAALLCGFGKNRSDVRESHAAQLLERLVPSSVMEWLAADPALMRELLAFLSAVNSAQSGAISELVLRAAAESGGRELLSRGEGDLTVQQVPPPTNPCDVKADASAATVATNELTLPDEEPEYLEDAEQEQPAPHQKALTTDPAFAQAPDAARRFICWLQQGLSDGTLRVNQAGALVHFVDEGMLLVSPRIFREFAKNFGEVGGGPANAPGEPDIAKSIQRQVLREGWHLRADKGVNILTYQVMRGNRAASRLSGVVIRNPVRFVDPVSPSNPLLVRLRDEQADA